MQRQVSDDGVYGELSSYYHCYTVDFYLQTLILAKLNRFAFPDCVSPGFCRWSISSCTSRGPDGTIPLIGDDDGGRVLAIVAENTTFLFAMACLTAAVLFGRR